MTAAYSMTDPVLMASLTEIYNNNSACDLRTGMEAKTIGPAAQQEVGPAPDVQPDLAGPGM